MYGKLLIQCELTVLTGMHIGTGNAFSSIGAVDSPVIRDAWSGQPMIPGSSLKGKMRTLLAKAHKNHYITQACKDDPEAIKSLFGFAGDKDSKQSKAARLHFSDCFLISSDSPQSIGTLTEVKFENTINRLSGEANPRQIERVVRNTKFSVRMIYDLEEKDHVKEDFDHIARAFKLLSMDYLGGHGTRGYGKVGFSNFSVKAMDGESPINITDLHAALKDVEQYAVFNLQA